MRSVVIAALGNIYYDTRTYNLYSVLKRNNIDTKFVGFNWLGKNFSSDTDENKIVINIVKGRFSLLFYIKFFALLIKFFLRSKADIYWAADIYTLPIVLFFAKIRNKKVYYDAREIYTGLNALVKKRNIQKIIAKVEEFCIKRVNAVFTTGELDSEFIEREYNISQTNVLRNLPLTQNEIVPKDLYTKFGIDRSKKILLYQGVVVYGRGLDTVYRLLQTNENYAFVVLGDGEQIEEYKLLADKLNITEKVIFVGKIPQSELLSYTAGAYVGLSLIGNTSLNNYYALPNKMFEYIMAEVPVIVTDLPQMSKIVDRYKVGKVIKDHDSNELGDVLEEWLSEPEKYHDAKKNCQIASKELNWETEFSKISHYFIY